MSFYPSAREREAALRRAIIGVKSDYFSWPIEIQEKYRVIMPKKDDFRIRQTLLKALFQIQVTTEEEMDAVFDSFDDEQYFLFNSTLLPVKGIGDDRFFLNEYLDENTTLLDFDTLYDFDYHDFCLQEQTREQENPQHISKPYRGSLDYCWARLEIDGMFHYANLSMAAHHLYGMLDESGFDRIGELIPHEYVDGKDHGKREGNGFIWDLRVDAAGMERQLDELQHRYYSYLSERRDALLNEFDEKAEGEVYLVDKSRPNEPQIEFVFTDKTALQAIRFRYFMGDCRRLVGDKGELDARAEQERQAAIAYLERNYQDILDNFDPKIVRFRKKRKIIMEDDALKDLL